MRNKWLGSIGVLVLIIISTVVVLGSQPVGRFTWTTLANAYTYNTLASPAKPGIISSTGVNAIVERWN